MIDVITGIAILVLTGFAIFNWKKIGAVGTSLKNLLNDDPTDSDLRLFKRKTRLEFQLLRNRIEDLEKLERSRLSTSIKHESRPAEIQPS